MKYSYPGRIFPIHLPFQSQSATRCLFSWYGTSCIPLTYMESTGLGHKGYSVQLYHAVVFAIRKLKLIRETNTVFSTTSLGHQRAIANHPAMFSLSNMDFLTQCRYCEYARRYILRSKIANIKWDTSQQPNNPLHTVLQAKNHHISNFNNFFFRSYNNTEVDLISKWSSLLEHLVSHTKAVTEY